MRLQLDLSPAEEEAIRSLAEKSGCPPDRVLHWALASYFDLPLQSDARLTQRVAAPATRSA